MRDMGEGTFLSVVIPAYNEEKRLGQTLRRISGFLSEKGYSFEIIVVDDGSSDGTESISRESGMREPVLKVLSNGINRGKGFSVRRGMNEASGRFVLFTDADLSTPIEELGKLERAVRDGADIAIGSRSIPGSEVKVPQPFYRVLMGKTFNLFVRSIVIRGLVDTQCGFKLFKGECLRDVLPEMKVDGFSFDVELLYIARRKGYRIKEVPVVWLDCRDSKVRPFRDSARMFFELVYMKWMHG